MGQVLTSEATKQIKNGHFIRILSQMYLPEVEISLLKTNYQTSFKNNFLGCAIIEDHVRTGYNYLMDHKGIDFLSARKLFCLKITFLVKGSFPYTFNDFTSRMRLYCIRLDVFKSSAGWTVGISSCPTNAKNKISKGLLQAKHMHITDSL